MTFGRPLPVPGLANIGARSVAALRLSPDYQTAYFQASGRPRTAGYDDLYTATRDAPNLPFGNVTPVLGFGINTSNEEFDPTVSGNGLTLLFARGEPGAAQVRLYYARRAGTNMPFTSVGLVPNVNDQTAAYDVNPFLREDGQVLYFASFRGSANNTDIYRTVWNDSGVDAGLDPPAPVSELNGDSSEIAPVVTPDELTIYYASDRKDGNARGNYDIWMATRQRTVDSFSNLMNVGELNSSDLDEPSFVTADGCTLYFSSARSGALSVYVATRGQ
jgi:Tol biopolymer transport system component